MSTPYQNKMQDERLKCLEIHIATLNSEMNEVNIGIANIGKDVGYIKDELKLNSADHVNMIKEIRRSNSKPSWLITGVITLLVSLIVYFLTHK